VNVLVCVKRVPAVAGKISLTADGRAIDTRHLAFTVSPHEECAAEDTSGGDRNTPPLPPRGIGCGGKAAARTATLQ
jgi:hypothetical protein